MGAVQVLRAEVGTVLLPLEVDGVEEARADLQDVLAHLDDYLLPRLADLDAPLLAVVGGSTGAGKSTLVNSLARSNVTKAGVLRPTTRASVLVHHPEARRWFEGPRILPGLTRVTGSSDNDDPGIVNLAESADLPKGLAVLDAPDIDSVVHANRELASQLLGAADLWIFVTTASRYADAVPWGFLRQAVDRGTSVAIVLDRVPPEAIVSIRDHLSGMLATEGLRSAPVFTLTESRLENGFLPEIQLAQLREWLGRLGDDSRAGGIIVRRTLAGALDSLDARIRTLADASSAQIQTVEQMRAIVQTSYAEARAEVEAGAGDGSLLRGEVLARWQEYVGTGELTRSFEAAVGRFRDRVSSAIGGRSVPTSDLGQALQTGIQELILAEAQTASARVARRWALVPGAEQTLTAQPELIDPPDELKIRVQRLVREWQDDVLQMVRAQGKDRRTTARMLSFGVNGVGVVLTLVVLTHTWGALGGAEIGVAGGSAVLAQKLLEAIFGDQAARELTEQARTRLIERVESLYASEEGRILTALDDIHLDTGTPERLLRAAAAIKAQR